MAIDLAEAQHLKRLRSILATAERGGVRALNEGELADFYALYRFASSLAARLESAGSDPGHLAEARRLFAQAHMVLYGRLQHPGRRLWSRIARFFVGECPRAIRAEWKLVLVFLAVFYGLAALAYAAVSRDLELAFSLYDGAAVEAEIEQLRKTDEGEPFRGNFTFGLETSPMAAGWIMGHNIFVSIVFFGCGLVPPVFLLLLARNALMLGTYTAVAGHWGQAGAISSILWCHGVIELQMIVLAGTAGLVLARALVAPGPWTRRHALSLESARAWRLLAPVPPFLVISGLIEGYVSPHAPTELRLLVAAGSGVLLAVWILAGGRGQSSMSRHARPSLDKSSSASLGPQVPAS